MKTLLGISLFLLVVVIFFVNESSPEKNRQITDKYPWQITVLPDGATKVFGLVLEKSTLSEANNVLDKIPEIALFETGENLSIEAYYNNVTLGKLIGSFIFSLDATKKQLTEIKRYSVDKKAAEKNGWKYILNKIALGKVYSLKIKNLIYIPVVQLDEKTIVQRFGKPAYRIRTKTKETGWHYLYPDKGLDLIYSEDGKEVLQYVLPGKFNSLLQPLQSH